MVKLGYVLLFLPLIACGVITLGTLSRRKASGIIAIAAMLAAFGLSLALFLHYLSHAAAYPLSHTIPWLDFSWLSLGFGILLDPLSLLMLLIVTGVGSAIFIYSWGYMHEDPGFSRYFACLSLFAFSMLGIVLANNLVQIFIFWELVGLSSYLLIGFWYEKASAADAGKKAFLVNRVGDFGFVLGIFFLWSISGLLDAPRTFDFLKLQGVLQEAVPAGLIEPGALTLIALLLFCGVLGKSAQFPLHVWLPDAMEGPTPVSALIHAATMVAAGVYLLARTFFLYAYSPEAMAWVANIGCFTALFAATLAVTQNDIKRILAYSTLSQLGYMVMALGLGGSGVGMFHLTTHAFFKALLFLGAGSIIHAVHSQNIWDMGGLLKKMPWTSWTFLIGTLALCGIFPLSGFWSKDEILTLAAHHGSWIYWASMATAFLTALYMGRLCFTVFFGAPKEKVAHAHESPAVMTAPLVFLAVLSVFGGFFGIPHFLAKAGEHHAAFEWPVAVSSTLVALAGLGLAFVMYQKQWISAGGIQKRARWIHRLLMHRYYIDDFYDGLVLYGQQSLAVLCMLFDRFIIMGLGVNGTAWLARKSGGLLRRFQTGRLQTYALLLFIGMTLLIFQWLVKPLMGRP